MVALSIPRELFEADRVDELNEILDKALMHPNTVSNYDLDREVFRNTSEAIIAEVFDIYIGDGKRILEVGSGLGELVKKVPKYKKQIQQSDISAETAQENKNIDPNSNIIVANACNLPFPKESLDVIVGYCSLDSLDNLKRELTEAKRVLRPNGLLINIQDLKAGSDRIFKRYNKSEYIAFPESDNEGHPLGARIVPKEEFYTKAKIQMSLVKSEEFEKLRNFIEFITNKYAINPRAWYLLLKGTDPQLISLIGEFGSKLFPDAQVVKYNEDFHDNLKNDLDNKGFKILEFGPRTKTDIERRKDVHEKFISRMQRYIGRTPCNTLHNDVGFYRCRFDPSIEGRLRLYPYDAIDIISTLHIVVAQKNDA